MYNLNTTSVWYSMAIFLQIEQKYKNERISQFYSCNREKLNQTWSAV